MKTDHFTRANLSYVATDSNVRKECVTYGGIGME